ncbi:hypothetical protein QTP70_020006 [Hemibagrus guttatus]|uniref:UPAR/Ly6 domain-containing protein n=1 Tax=Hemibagrus guttatus TaxID=175788 RepID=A0AAE0UVD3_9TELE|nr:hypothetical protein QTP70_020006 [Hemibagrus guttatus]
MRTQVTLLLICMISSGAISLKCYPADYDYDTVMPQQSINGRKCYTCNDIDCSQKLYCEGEEDRCITAIVAQGTKTMTMKGCTTRNICNTTFFRAHGLIITDVFCCEGNFCNGAEIFTLSFLLMFIPLLPSILF